MGCDAHHGLTTPSTPPRRRHHYHSFGCNIYNAEVPPSKLRDVSREAKQRAHAEVNRMLARQRRRIVNGGIGPEGAAAAGGETTSVVSSCSSFQVAGGRRGGRPGDGDAEEEEEEEEENEQEAEDRARAARCVGFIYGCVRYKVLREDWENAKDGSLTTSHHTPTPKYTHKHPIGSCCIRWLYPLCFALAPAGFHRYAQEKMVTSRRRRRLRARPGGGAAHGPEDDAQSIVSASFTLEMGEGEEEDDDLLLWRSRRPTRSSGGGLGGLRSTML